ncbi:MAG: hypothetical protein QF723_00625 [Phycisphaerales bacterium]|jgi:hypothetical protein|nr:hypothetical protein [Phycisphaerales bacterium]MDP6311571.1 hypothetical protein [Phycisphaerales bacterium]MDP6480096.1 hypothetical protein [Phycisphaerales bacterium]MDP6891299.1 hypothetical protein [Phycisphaerales bacterium]MDP7088034.1 hypothetical protein [Phycisphaerales bacterium]|tara:strand:+ start:1058 stop:1234 length:177 start_codon:yes stop_codon:yes gene_type:complete
MSRFATTSAKATMDVFTAISGVAVLFLVLGCLWLVFHNMEYSSTSDGRDDGGIFKVLD